MVENEMNNSDRYIGKINRLLRKTVTACSHVCLDILPQKIIVLVGENAKFAFNNIFENIFYRRFRPVYSSPCFLDMKGHQLYSPSSFTQIGVKSGKMTSAYSASPIITVVAICKSESTPDGNIAANVPPKITVAEIMTVPILRIVRIMPSYSIKPRYSSKRLIKKIL